MNELKIKCICAIICTLLLCGTLIYCTAVLKTALGGISSVVDVNGNEIANQCTTIGNELFRIAENGVGKGGVP